MQMLADKLVELKLVESISDSTVQSNRPEEIVLLRPLKKTRSSRGIKTIAGSDFSALKAGWDNDYLLTLPAEQTKANN